MKNDNDHCRDLDKFILDFFFFSLLVIYIDMIGFVNGVKCFFFERLFFFFNEKNNRPLIRICWARSLMIRSLVFLQVWLAL